jgi:phage tail sheath protein FI
MAVQNFGSGGGGFQLSPGVNISEVDLTTVTPAVDTTVGAFAGVFRWGPVNERVLVTSENDLVAKCGKPTSINPETFFTAANFLAYSNALYLVRAANTVAQFAAIGGSTAIGGLKAITVATAGSLYSNADTFTIQAGTGGANSTGNVVTNASGNLVSYSVTSFGSGITNTAVTITTSTGTGGALTATVVSSTAAYTVFNNDEYETKSSGWTGTGTQYIARWAGALGNSLKVSVCENANQYTSTTDVTALTYTLGTPAGGAQGNTAPFDGANTGLVINVGSTTGTLTLDGGLSSSGYDAGGTIYKANSAANFLGTITAVADSFALGDYITVSAGGGTQSLKITSKTASTFGVVNNGIGIITFTFDQPLKLAADVATETVQRNWEYFSQVNGAPGRSDYVSVNGNTALQIGNTTVQNDEVHVVVVDEDGEFTGNPGAVLEVWESLSRATDAKLSDGTSNYYKTIINERSGFVWAADDRATARSNTALNVASATGSAPLTTSLSGGVDQSETEVAFTAIATAYDKFVSPEDIDISLVLTGAPRGGTHGEQLPNYLIDNLAETRKDCVVFVSPAKADVVNAASPETNVVEFRNAVRSSSYAFMDSGYKQQYDKYNDLYRWVPMNGDVAGLCVRTDSTRDPWFSPAGSSRGQIKNVIKLAFNPNKAQRDYLYKNGVNPVISQQGEGTLLFGDKTLLARPSAFDRINVRRLFITLEKAISTAAKSFLFEFNDEFTRAQFRNLVEPFLRDVQGRRGIYDFKVVCDETNNTPEVIDANRFVGDIYIKPARSINYIQLNFVAVRSGIEFSEIVG